jgi:hypothetical protein
MKSVDRDFVRDGHMSADWLFAYVFVAGGAFVMLVRIWMGVHPRGLVPYTLFQIIWLPLLFISPLIFAFLFRRYIRSALNEDLVSERVAENCEYWIGRLIFIVYFAFFWFSERLVIG